MPSSAVQSCPQAKPINSNNDIYLNETLFHRIKIVHSKLNSDNYNEEDSRLINEIFNAFVRNGSNLNIEDKKTYRSISQELSKLSPKFSENVLKASKKTTNPAQQSSREI